MKIKTNFGIIMVFSYDEISVFIFFHFKIVFVFYVNVIWYFYEILNRKSFFA